MKYFLDTEFHEYKKKPLIGKAIDTIELISIGIVSEDSREYYAICNEFDVNTAWNNEWLKDNVLKPIYRELRLEELNEIYDESICIETYFRDKNYKKELIRLLNKYGKSKNQIAEEVFNFVNPDLAFHVSGYCNSELREGGRLYDHFEKHNVTLIDNRYVAQPQFYAYYADYDWVVFCWLFGRMIGLPKGFPMYCIDLKQILDEKEKELMSDIDFRREVFMNSGEDFSNIKTLIGFPKQENEHNALDDAKWNRELHLFINSL